MKGLPKALKDPQVWLLVFYLVLISLLRWRLDWQLIDWFIGGFVGWGLVVIDRFVWVYWTRPQAQLSVQVRYFLNNRRFKEAWQVLQERKHEQRELSFRSVLFQLAWVPLAFFALTSTTSMFGQALVMAIGLHLLYDEWKDYLRSPEYLRSWLFWQIKRTVSLQEQKIYLWTMSAVFLLLTCLLV